jgi:putative chitinase
MSLKRGSKGEDVKRIQILLGLSNPDGIFGKNTEDAVRQWQKKNGLKEDGIIGPKTLELMFQNSNETEVKVINKSPFSRLNGHVPPAILQELLGIYEQFSITNSLRVAHFLSQCAHESTGFTRVFENLNYSPSGLKRVFSTYFPGNLNESYAHKPIKIASRVYGNRMGNGDENSEDGYKYRGRGYLQLTGKSNYSKFSKFIGDDVVSNPDLVATKYPLASAAFFFNSNGLWTICDRGATDEVVTAVTKRVNGGTIGLADRIKHFKEYYKLLT